MLIEKYDIHLESPPCHPGSERWTASADLPVSIADVLPLLNARLRGAVYDHQEKVLTWRMGGRAVFFRPSQIGVSNLESRQEAEVVLGRLVDLANKAWLERDSIEPSYVKRERPQALQVYKLLPGHNCKVCGQPTCFTFALRLATDQANVRDCAPLFTDEFASRREELMTLLGSARSDVFQSTE